MLRCSRFCGAELILIAESLGFVFWEKSTGSVSSVLSVGKFICSKKEKPFCGPETCWCQSSCERHNGRDVPSELSLKDFSRISNVVHNRAAICNWVMVMVMKEYSAYPKAPALLGPRHHIV